MLCIYFFFTPTEKCHTSKQKLNYIIFDQNCCSVLKYLRSLDKNIQLRNILLSAKILNNVKNYLKNLMDKDSKYFWMRIYKTRGKCEIRWIFHTKFVLNFAMVFIQILTFNVSTDCSIKDRLKHNNVSKTNLGGKLSFMSEFYVLSLFLNLFIQIVM